MSENNQLNNSTSDSDRKKLNIKSKNVNYSTDYHVDLLHASEKMIPVDQRVNFMKNLDSERMVTFTWKMALSILK